MSVDDILYSPLSEPCFLCGSTQGSRKENETMAICKSCQATFDELLDEMFNGEGA